MNFKEQLKCAMMAGFTARRSFSWGQAIETVSGIESLDMSHDLTGHVEARVQHLTQGSRERQAHAPGSELAVSKADAISS